VRAQRMHADHPGDPERRPRLGTRRLPDASTRGQERSPGGFLLMRFGHVVLLCSLALLAAFGGAAYWLTHQD